MSNDNSQLKQFNCNDDEEKFGSKHKPWNYPDPSTNINQSQNRTCCSPVDEIEAMEPKDGSSNSTHSVEVQTEKSTLFLLKQDKKIDISKKNIAQITSHKELVDNKKMHLQGNSNIKHYQGNELENIKLKKTGLNYLHEKITTKLAANINTPEVFDEYAETDLDQPMDYTLCYDEINQDEEKKGNSPYLTKKDFLCIEEVIEEEKIETVKPKGTFNKEPTRNKKEMFSNTSRSFKEIFNFFKDRDKKRSAIESTKVSTLEQPKLLKTAETFEQKFEKFSQATQTPAEQCEKETKSKNEAQCSQQTPLMFSRCSSLGSLNGFEQNSINDDRSSIISDFSRRTSGVVSPSELPDSPAQTAPSGTRLQQKSQIGCFGKKKIQFPQQDKLKVSQYSATSNDNSLLQNENNYKKPSVSKLSVFEDNLTSFKDESTPTKLHSMAASSLSSLTIDDDDDDELMNKILNKEKQNIIEETKIQNNRQEPIRKSSHLLDSSTKTEKATSPEQSEDLNGEANDELTDLTPYEEQILDECIRRGIAKWTKQNINEIKPFSWDIGLTCRATRSILTSRIRVNSRTDIKYDKINQKRKSHQKNQTITNNEYPNENSDPNELESNREELDDHFNENSYYITYEEHLLDQCIRRGMAKITKRSIDAIKPFSWDANQICLTTRAMMLRSRDENIHGSH